MPKLNQVIAVVQPKKQRAVKLAEQIHRGWGKDLISGMSRTYEAFDEGGDKLPPEMRVLQLRAWEAISHLQKEMIDYYDVVATQETGNQAAKANVVVDGKVILQNVPVTVLLFLEKQTIDLITIIREIPSLPSDREWRWDDSRNCFVTEAIKQNRTAKVPQTHVLHPPTKEHPAQCEMYHIDKPVGEWTVTHFSGGIPASVKANMLDRAEKFQDALKSAREEANSTEVKNVEIGSAVMDFVFGPCKEVGKERR